MGLGNGRGDGLHQGQVLTRSAPRLRHTHKEPRPTELCAGVQPFPTEFWVGPGQVLLRGTWHGVHCLQHCRTLVAPPVRRGRGGGRRAVPPSLVVRVQDPPPNDRIALQPPLSTAQPPAGRTPAVHRPSRSPGAPCPPGRPFGGLSEGVQWYGIGVQWASGTRTRKRAAPFGLWRGGTTQNPRGREISRSEIYPRRI